MKEKQSLLTVNLAVLLFGLAGLFAKWISLPAVEITFGRVFFSAITLYLFRVFSGGSFRVRDRKDLLTLMLAGAVLALHWWSFLASVQLSTVAIGTITFSSFPLFVIFLEPLIYHKKLRWGNVLEALCILAGVFVTVPSFSFENSYVRGICVGLASALLYAILTLVNKQLSGRYESSQISFYEQTTAAVVLLPVVLATKVLTVVQNIAALLPSPGNILLLLFLGVFTTALAHTLFIAGLKSVPARVAGIISSMETVYGILFAWILLGEVPSGREILGGVIILGVVGYVQLRKSDT